MSIKGKTPDKSNFGIKNPTYTKLIDAGKHSEAKSYLAQLVSDQNLITYIGGVPISDPSIDKDKFGGHLSRAHERSQNRKKLEKKRKKAEKGKSKKPKKQKTGKKKPLKQKIKPVHQKSCLRRRLQNLKPRN